MLLATRGDVSCLSFGNDSSVVSGSETATLSNETAARPSASGRKPAGIFAETERTAPKTPVPNSSTTTPALQKEFFDRTSNLLKR